MYTPRRILALSIALLATAAVGTTLLRAGDDAKKHAKAKIGEAAPAFSLPDQEGQTVSLSDFAGKIVVLEWFNNDCPFVVKHYQKQHMNELASKYEDKGVVWLAINSTSTKDVADNKAIAGEWKIDRPILMDKSGSVGKSYGARTTPHMYIIDKDGKLVYAGGIDNKKSTETDDIEKSTNYVAKALDEVLDGKPVSQAETEPYGCSVKYAK